jgi:TRAP-type mannitol/chloroaromatic compound transport system substrate-binding protein
MERRKFIKNMGIGAAAIGTGLAAKAVPVSAQKKFNWKMVTTWPPHFPALGEGADLFSQWVDEMSDGRLKITVYGGGELVPPLQVFDAVSQGTVEMGHGAAYYWAGKMPACQFFAAVPFGLNAQGLNAWILNGGGMKLWEETYAPFNVKPFLAGNTGVQAGGWFNKEIKTIDDYKGLKMRIPGLGGKVIKKAGGTAVLVAGGEIYTNLDRGVIDATEWVGPYHDLKMGFYKAAKNYYWPGWHEPGTGLEIIVGQKAWDSLPKDLQAIVKAGAARSNIWMLSEFEARNNAALQVLINKHKVQVKQFPEAVLKDLKNFTDDVVAEVAAKDPMSKKVYEAYSKFKKEASDWGQLTEEQYHTFKHL